MKARRILTVTCAVLALSVLPAPAQSATKSCTTAPAKPVVRAAWAATGGPAITVAAAAGKSVATGARWTVSYFNPSTLRWSAYSAWKTMPVTTKPKLFLRPGLATSKSLVNVVAIATNACGSSAQRGLQVPLRAASALIAQPTLAESIPLRVGDISFDEIAGDATRGLPLSLISSTPDVCASDAAARKVLLKAAGECQLRISERNASITIPNADVERTINVVADIAPLPVSPRDRADERTGFQIHVVYVTPHGAASHDYVGSGHLDLWVALAQRWMSQRIGRTFAFDTFGGRLDVSTLASGMSLDEMRARTGGETAGTDELLSALATEFVASNGSALPGKNLLFVLDGKLSDGYCGFADSPGSLALVTAASPGCWTGDDAFVAEKLGLNWMSATIIHELLHNVGVPHICTDRSDIMLGDGCEHPEASEALTLDATHTKYLGGSGAKLDIREVKVWADGSGSRHIAVDGLCYVGEACALERTWWSAGDQTLALQQLVLGAWVTIERFSSRRDAVTSPNYPYTYDTTVTPAKTGTFTYRYRLEPTSGWAEHLGDAFSVVVPY